MNPDLPESFPFDLAPFCARHGVELAVLFGSRASGNARAKSDADLALKFSDSTPTGDRLDLLHELDRLLGLPVDLVLLAPETDPLLRHEIFSGGRPVFEARPGLFSEHKARAWHSWIDTAPLRERERRVVEGKIEEMNRLVP